jgi:hypothetical protein
MPRRAVNGVALCSPAGSGVIVAAWTTGDTGVAMTGAATAAAGDAALRYGVAAGTAGVVTGALGSAASWTGRDTLGGDVGTVGAAKDRGATVAVVAGFAAARFAACAAVGARCGYRGAGSGWT